jgi:Leucine-rich repeat (LRR) protein
MLEKGHHLRSIDLRNNQIKNLPDAIGFLPILWKLRVDYNLLTGLPETIGHLTKLEVLTAS